MENSDFKKAMNRIRKHLDAEGISYVLIAANHQEAFPTDGFFGTSKVLNTSVFADILFQVANSGHPVAQKFIERILENIGRTAAEAIESLKDTNKIKFKN